jgi:hypothetical protein
LIQPNRLNIGGVVYEKGKRVEVDMETAFGFAGNPRFKVHGLDSRAAFEFKELANRPHGAVLYDAINDAIDRLDPDDDASFERNGKPSVAAISNVLGYPVTAAERDAATVAPKVTLEAAEPAPAKAEGGSRIVRPSNLKIKQPAPQAAEPSGPL